jgi:glucose/arabinose dehydrogenase
MFGSVYNLTRILALLVAFYGPFIASSFGQPGVATQSLPTGFSTAKVQDGYVTPMGTVFTPDGKKLFVWDKVGRVWVSNWDGTQYLRQANPVLDLSDEVGNWRDFGLLSFCLDPNFGQNGLVYLFYMVDRYHLFNANTASYDPNQNQYFMATISRVTRYQVQASGSDLVAGPASRKVLLGETRSTGVPLTHESHAGGTLIFGRDGSLLVSTGDNASYSSTDIGSASETYYQQAIDDGIMTANENVGAFRAQMITSLCGKVLRLDPATGNGLSSNPFSDGANPRSARSRVWTLGLRNPYRMTIQPNTGSTNITDGNPGTLLIGDVGWATWEDMHVVKQSGENAGWPVYEGLEEKPSYSAAAKTLANKDEPNPTNTCNIPFLRFGDLLKQAASPAQGTTQALNPCSLQPLPGLQRRHFHSRPALDWKHEQYVARVPSFSGNTATTTPLSGTLGTPFRGNCSTGGAYYAGTAFPASHRNVYFFADYGENWIRKATLNTDGSLNNVQEFLPGGVGKGIVDIEYNPLDGSLYYVNINTGEIMKISYGGNQPPVAAATADKQSGTSPLTVNFTGSNSTDPDGDPLTYLWDFGDSTTSTIANPTKTFTAFTTQGFTVRLTVNDGRGLTDSKTLVISINNTAPTAKITAPLNNAQYPLDRQSSYKLTASVTDENPVLLTYAWQVSLRHNNHEHREPVLTDVSPTVIISPVGCDGETYYYFIKLTVTDAGGLTATDSVKIYPNCASVNLTVTNATTTPGVTSALVKWANPTAPFSDLLVVAKAGSGFQGQPTGTSYVDNADFTGNGATLEGGKVVYQGAGTSVTVTNLTAGQRYYFRIYTRSGSVWTGGVEVSTTPTAPAPPPTNLLFDTTACYRIVARVNGGSVVSIDGGNTASGVQARLRTNTSQPWQQWHIKPATANFYQIEAVHSGKALTIDGASAQDYANLTQQPFAGSTNQQWDIGKNSDGYYALKARHSGKAMDIKWDGVDVVQYSVGGSWSQQWGIEKATCNTGPVSPPTEPPTSQLFDTTACYQIASRVGNGSLVGIDGGSMANDALVRQRPDANRMWQQWRIKPTATNYYRLEAVHSSKTLTVDGASGQDYANLTQQPFTGSTNQQWTVEPNSDGYYALKARHSGKAMDVKWDGVDIVQYSVGESWSQQWRIEKATCSTNNAARLGDEAVGRAPAAAHQEPMTRFRLWPNPAHDYVQIDLRPAAGQPADIVLLNLTGSLLYRTRVDSASEPVYQLDTRSLSAGVYLITIQTPNQQPTTLRVLISR